MKKWKEHSSNWLNINPKVTGSLPRREIKLPAISQNGGLRVILKLIMEKIKLIHKLCTHEICANNIYKHTTLIYCCPLYSKMMLSLYVISTKIIKKITGSFLGLCTLGT